MSEKKFDQTKYINKWAKENMKQVKASYKAEFVKEFKEALKLLNDGKPKEEQISQSDVIREAMLQVIKKAKKK